MCVCVWGQQPCLLKILWNLDLHNKLQSSFVFSSFWDPSGCVWFCWEHQQASLNAPEWTVTGTQILVCLSIDSEYFSIFFLMELLMWSLKTCWGSNFSDTTKRIEISLKASGTLGTLEESVLSEERSWSAPTPVPSGWLAVPAAADRGCSNWSSPFRGWCQEASQKVGYICIFWNLLSYQCIVRIPPKPALISSCFTKLFYSFTCACCKTGPERSNVIITEYKQKTAAVCCSLHSIILLWYTSYCFFLLSKLDLGSSNHKQTQQQTPGMFAFWLVSSLTAASQFTVMWNTLSSF